MSQYVFEKDTLSKNNHNVLIDLRKTMVCIDRSYRHIYQLAKSGKTILFVGTKHDIVKNHLKKECKRVGAYYVNQRWLGGTLTNFKILSKSIEKLNNLIAMIASGEINKYPHKERISLQKKMEKMEKFFGGIRMMNRLPSTIVICDIMHDKIAANEAKKCCIDSIGVGNTNAKVNLVDIIIPANTGSIKTICLIISILCDAIADANNLPLSVAGKNDSEIILPDIPKISPGSPTSSIISHK
jgi:small subunit ribosomal protein S2